MTSSCLMFTSTLLGADTTLLHAYSFLCFKLDALTFNCNQVCFEIIRSRSFPCRSKFIKIIQVDRKKPLRFAIEFFHTTNFTMSRVFFGGAFFGGLKDYPSKILHLNFTAWIIPSGEILEDGVNFHTKGHFQRCTKSHFHR